MRTLGQTRHPQVDNGGLADGVMAGAETNALDWLRINFNGQNDVLRRIGHPRCKSDVLRVDGIG